MAWWPPHRHLRLIEDRPARRSVAIVPRAGAASELADDDLALRLVVGDMRAFEALYDRHAGAGFALACRLVGDPATAEDVIQEAFLSIWRGRAGYRRELGSFRTWALGIIRHKAFDALRRRSAGIRELPDGGEVAARRPSRELTDIAAIGRMEARGVRLALHALSAEQRQTIELAFLAGLSHTEIAARLELPVGTVKGRARLGLAKLRVTLEADAA